MRRSSEKNASDSHGSKATEAYFINDTIRWTLITREAVDMLEIDPVSELLKRALHDIGIHFATDARLCRACLMDMPEIPPQQRNCLVISVEANVPADLSSRNDLPPRARLNLLSRRLTENYGIETGLARWATTAWAIALDLGFDPVAKEFYARTISQPNAGSKKDVNGVKTGITLTQPGTNALRADPAALDFGSLTPGQGASATLRIRGGPGRVVSASDSVTATPDAFGAGETTLVIEVKGGAEGLTLASALFLDTGKDRLEIPVRASWSPQGANSPAFNQTLGNPRVTTKPGFSSSASSSRRGATAPQVTPPPPDSRRWLRIVGAITLIAVIYGFPSYLIRQNKRASIAKTGSPIEIRDKTKVDKPDKTPLPAKRSGLVTRNPIAKERADEAWALYDDVMKTLQSIRPNRLTADQNRDLRIYLRKKCKECIKKSNAAIAADPGYVKGYLYKIYALFLMDDYSSARQILSEALRRFPDDEDLLTFRKDLDKRK